MITLYSKDNLGKIRIWTVRQHLDDLLIIEHGLMDGALQTQIERVPKGKAGRSLQEQIESRMESRVNKQLLKGYVKTLKEAVSRKIPLNVLGMPKPMLAQKDIPLPNRFYLQNKYNGNRCLIGKKDGKPFAYSRNGKEIHSIDHILNDVTDMPDDTVLDGELYVHGVPLQTIRSWIARKQTDSINIQYICYDIIDVNLSFEKRFEILKTLPLGNAVSIAPTIYYEDSTTLNINEKLNDVRLLGYEGLIIRHPDYTYEVGKRSKGLIKVKHWDSEEFKVISIEESMDGWAVLVCETANGDTFKVSAPGSIDFKMLVLKNPKEYIGKDVTVEYSEITKDGIPFHPVAIAFREGKE